MSTSGLDGVLSWAQAHLIAGTCAQPLAPVWARLDEAAGSLLARPLATLDDDPSADVAAINGYAICGQGPWNRTLNQALAPGECNLLRAGEVLPKNADAVLEMDRAVSESGRGGTMLVTGRDELSGLADERVRPELGAGIARRGSRAKAGTTILPAGRLVTAPILALAAAAGHDELSIIKPPVVGTLVLGNALLSSGRARKGRVRDALGNTVPAFVAALGARGNPAVRAPDTHELLLAEIEDANVDVLITTGATSPGDDSSVRKVLRDLDARWLIDGVSVTPGAQMLLARLPDGRFIIGLPGDPQSALAGLVTLVAPLITILRGAPLPVNIDAVLAEDAPFADFADDTRLAPVILEGPESALIARPVADTGPAGLSGWANADGIAIVPPAKGYRGDAVSVMRL